MILSGILLKTPVSVRRSVVNLFNYSQSNASTDSDQCKATPTDSFSTRQ